MSRDTEQINRYIQTELRQRRLTDVSAVEAARWLDEAGLLPDSPDRPGKPLRQLLRDNEIRGGFQDASGRWWIKRVESFVVEEQVLNIGTVSLEWSPWVFCSELRRDSSTMIPENPGVYEVARAGATDEHPRLIIGESNNIERRIRRDFLNPKCLHSSGRRLREAESLSDIQVRWAITDRRHAAKEELLRLHLVKFGRPPVYMTRYR